MLFFYIFYFNMCLMECSSQAEKKKFISMKENNGDRVMVTSRLQSDKYNTRNR